MSAPDPTIAKASLSGIVRARGTRRPIVGAFLIDVETGAVVETDAKGYFSFALTPGGHTLEVKAPGFKPRRFVEQLGDDQALDVIYALDPERVKPFETVVRDEKERREVSRITLRDEEVHEVPGTLGDPFRVVMLMPGVSSVASGISYPVVRGSQPAATGTFLDGVRIPILFHLGLGPAVVHPDFIAGMDFYPGVAPVSYGRVMGGVIDGTPSRAREDRLHATAYVDLINAGAFVEAPISSTGTHLTLAGRFSYSAWLLGALAGGFIGPDAQTRADFYDGQLRLEQRLGAGKLRVLGLASSDLFEAKNVGLARIGAGARLRFERLDARYRHPLGVGELEVGATVGRDEAAISAFDATVLSGEFAMSSLNFAGRASWTGAVAAGATLTVGGEVEHRRGGTDLSGNASPLGSPADGTVAYLANRSIGTISGAYAQLAWTPGSWTVVPSFRVDDYHLVPGVNHVAYEPRLIVRKQLSDRLSLKGGGGLFHQPPTVLVNLPVSDIAGLRHGLQQSAQFDVGFEWKPFDGLEVNADVYYNPIFRAVEFDLFQLTRLRPRQNQPVEAGASGRSYGFEVMVRKPLGQNWFAWLSYGYSRSTRVKPFKRYDDNDEVIETVRGELPFAFDQTHVVNGTLTYRFDNGWSLGTVLHFHTGRPESGEVSTRDRRLVERDGRPVWVREDLDRASRLPPFFRVDARVSKSWVFDDFVLDAYLDVMNASLQSEVFGFERYSGIEPDGNVVVERPFALPLIYPLLGVKGSY